MASKGEPIRIGPFIGGLNNASDPTAVADVELVDCVNFELDQDFSLISRPPFVEVENMSGTWTERIYLLGVAVLPGGTYIIGSNVNGIFSFASSTWSLITNTFQSRAMVQYDNKIWLVPIPGSSNPGGSWDGTTFTAVASMPQGEAAVMHKERMFIVPGQTATSNTSRLHFSNVGNPGTWSGSDNIDINKGDGQKLMDVIVHQDNLMLFKSDSTYYLAYDVSPTAAVRRQVHNTVGVSRRRCVLSYEGSIYLYHEGNIYEIVNLDFSRINSKVPFVYDPTAPSSFSDEVFLSLFGDRLLVRYFNRIYVYGLRTRTWSRWESSDPKLHYFGPVIGTPSDVTQAVNDQYFAGSCLTANETVTRMNDGYDGSIVERTIADADIDIECSLLTKNFDLAIPHQFKRLFTWGADVLTNQDVVGIATPIVFGFKSSWEDLESSEWGELFTWGQPLMSPVGVTTTVATGSGTLRRYARFLKGLRFRQINFGIELKTKGSFVDGPARVFTLTIITKSGHMVSKGIS